MTNYLLPACSSDDEPTRLSKELLVMFSVNDNICIIASCHIKFPLSRHVPRVKLRKMIFTLELKTKGPERVLLIIMHGGGQLQDDSGMTPHCVTWSIYKQPSESLYTFDIYISHGWPYAA